MGDTGGRGSTEKVMSLIPKIDDCSCKIFFTHELFFSVWRGPMKRYLIKFATFFVHINQFKQLQNLLESLSHYGPVHFRLYNSSIHHHFLASDIGGGGLWEEGVQNFWK